jgi:hypothetical protein
MARLAGEGIILAVLPSRSRWNGKKQEKHRKQQPRAKSFHRKSPSAVDPAIFQ